MNSHKNIMILGTASSVGKSLITAALCRIFVQDGYKTAPFKSQNMALNSFVTSEGLEMGRAQVVQAEAAKIKPKVFMNPILLKPTSNTGSQVILEGKVHKTLAASEYFKFRKELKNIILKNYNILKENYEIGVIEGAGSPAEINLAKDDIVNMGMAEMVDAPVILVADIERGGVFASVYGTIKLLPQSQQDRIKGVIINKFRGDIEIFKPGIKMLEDLIDKPVLGVLPYVELNIEDEDSQTNKFDNYKRYSNNFAFRFESTTIENQSCIIANKIDIAVIKLPHISNFTDFDIFKIYDDVNLRYVQNPQDIGTPDILIIPGSKNTIEDLIRLKNTGFEKVIYSLNKKNVNIIGICGGYQMLGKKIMDPFNVESNNFEVSGFGLLDIQTEMLKEKTTLQMNEKINSKDAFFQDIDGQPIKGYEIHMGKTIGEFDNIAFIKRGEEVIAVKNKNIIGTYIHGIFDNTNFTDKILNIIRNDKKMNSISIKTTYEEFKDNEYNKLSAHFRKYINMDKIYNILIS